MPDIAEETSDEAGKLILRQVDKGAATQHIGQVHERHDGDQADNNAEGELFFAHITLLEKRTMSPLEMLCIYFSPLDLINQAGQKRTPATGGSWFV